MKRRNATTMQGALAGGVGGAEAGSAAGPWGALAGGIAGAGLGAFTGNMAGGADDELNSLNIDEQKAIIEDARRKNRTAATNENGMNIFRKFMGAAFKSSSPSSMAAALKPYPGLGNQGIP